MEILIGFALLVLAIGILREIFRAGFDILIIVAIIGIIMYAANR